MGVSVPNEPINRKEQYLAKIAGQAVEIPAEPITREEAYLDYIAKHGGGGGGGTNDYDELLNQPKINDVTLKGNKSLSDLGIASASALANKVDKVAGKGLSTNDYSNEDKAIVGGVTAALADKVDKVDGKGLSTNDFTDAYKTAIGDNTTAISGIKNGEGINSFGGVESALALKQNATDNSLDTEAKTIVGAINENAGDISTLKSGFTALDNEVNGDATTYPYADVITINDAVPANLAGCMVKIEPVQSGTGTPSPENVRPITGHTECVVTRASQNMAGNLTQGYWAAADGAATQSQEWVRTDKLACIPNRTYRILSEHLTRWTTCCVYDSQGTFLEVLGEASGSAAHKVDVTVTVPSNAYYMGWSIANPVRPNPLTPSDITDLKLFDASTIAQYTIALGDTIYGGTVDFDSGVMTVTHRIIMLKDLSWSYLSQNTRFIASISDAKIVDASTIADISCEICKTVSWGDYGQANYDCICLANISGTNYVGLKCFSCESVEDLLVVLDNYKMTYPIATPTTIQLTPEQIQLLQGTNTLYASTGDISVTVNGVSGAIGAVQTAVNELAADIAEQLPTAPTTDGAYVLTVTVADGTPTYSWESAE